MAPGADRCSGAAADGILIAVEQLMTQIENVNDVLVDRPGDFWRAPAVAGHYERCRFDNLKGRLYRTREEAIIERALSGLAAGCAVLDAPCGTGRLMSLLRRRGLRPTGCDISVAMMAVARRQLAAAGASVPLVASDIQHLPYPRKSFDAAICIGLLMHLDAEARVGALRQLASVARERLIVQYGCLNGLNRVKARLTGRAVGNVRFAVSPVEMQTDFERSGLTERARYRILPGLSSSVVVVLTP
jgi:SAM-dependent methyltransferase